MIDLLIKDLAMEMVEAETDDKSAQVDCELMMRDSKANRTTDSKTLPAKSCVKADTEAKLQAHGEHHAEGSRVLIALPKYISSLQLECDWLLQYFEVREHARSCQAMLV